MNNLLEISRYLKMSFLWIHIHSCLYSTEYTLFYKTLNIYAFVKISGLRRKHHIFFSIDFHVDIGIKTVDAYLYHFLIFL